MVARGAVRSARQPRLNGEREQQRQGLRVRVPGEQGQQTERIRPTTELH